MKYTENNEFKCLDEPSFMALYLFMIFMLCAFISCTIALIVYLAKGFDFTSDAVGVLTGFSVLTLILGVILFVSLYGSKQGVFKINKEECLLNSKIKGEIINIKLNTTDIKRIEIRDFSNTHRAVCIVLVDGKGTYGKTVFTKNGEYIKLRYTKKRLKKIQEFLPECPLVYSNFHAEEIIDI